MHKLTSLLGLLLLTGVVAPAFAGKTQNVVLIVSDGLRWQEMFQGADPLLLDAKNGGNWVSDAELKKRYWRESPQERRQLVFPFIWGTVAKQGQIFGNVTGRDPRSLGAAEQSAAALGIEPSLAGKLQQIAAETLAAEK